MESDKISIIVPVYKVEEYLEECVVSLRNQTYKNIEIILIDDGSPDRCPQMCDNYAQTDARIKVVHQQNGGVSVARNSGIDISTGEYITFVDSDDYVDENYIELLYRNLKGCYISECGTILFDENGLQSTKNAQPLILNWENYLTETGLNGFLSYAVVYSKLFDKRLFEDIRFPIGRANYEDESTVYKLVYRAKKVSRIYTPLYYYRQRLSGASKNKTTQKRVIDSENFFSEKIQFFIDENRMDLARFFKAKKAISFIGFCKKTDDSEIICYCLKTIKDMFKQFWWCKNIPMKYKLYVVYFILLHYSILEQSYDKDKKNNK